MDTPHKFIETKWGRVRALCGKPDEILFQTGFGDEREDDPQRITINRKDYLLEWGVQKAKPEGRHAEPYEGGWYSRQLLGLRVSEWLSNSSVTDAARRVFKDEIVPVLVEWANSDEAKDLLDEGKAAHFRNQVEQAVTTRDVLNLARERIDSIIDKIKAGHELTTDEVTAIHAARVIRDAVNGVRR